MKPRARPPIPPAMRGTAITADADPTDRSGGAAATMPAVPDHHGESATSATALSDITITPTTKGYAVVAGGQVKAMVGTWDEVTAYISTHLAAVVVDGRVHVTINHPGKPPEHITINCEARCVEERTA